MRKNGVAIAKLFKNFCIGVLKEDREDYDKRIRGERAALTDSSTKMVLRRSVPGVFDQEGRGRVY